MRLLIAGDGKQILYVFYAKAKKVITSLINRTQQGAVAVFRRQAVHIGTARYGYHGYKNRVLNRS